MSWNLFIDDERWPKDATWAPHIALHDEWVIARNWEEVRGLIHNLGLPDTISFDHDLGENEPTGDRILSDMIEAFLDGNEDYKDLTLASVFVHSQNPVGAHNISKRWENFCRHWA